MEAVKQKIVKQEITFRIVKDRWYHRVWDKLYVAPSSKKAISYHQVHLSANIMKYKNKWFLAKPFEKIVIPELEVDHQKEWASEIGDPNYNENEAPFGFEIDMSHIAAMERGMREEIKKENSWVPKSDLDKEMYAKGFSPDMDLNDIESINDFPIELILKVCDDPKMVKIIAGFNPSYEVLEAMTNKVQEQIRELKEKGEQGQEEMKPEQEEEKKTPLEEKAEETELNKKPNTEQVQGEM